MCASTKVVNPIATSQRSPLRSAGRMRSTMSERTSPRMTRWLPWAQALAPGFDARFKPCCLDQGHGHKQDRLEVQTRPGERRGWVKLMACANADCRVLLTTREGQTWPALWSEWAGPDKAGAAFRNAQARLGGGERASRCRRLVALTCRGPTGCGQGCGRRGSGSAADVSDLSRRRRGIAPPQAREPYAASSLQR